VVAGGNLDTAFIIQLELGQLQDAASSWFILKVWPNSWAAMVATDATLLSVSCVTPTDE
jgi:hypothetical protein